MPENERDSTANEPDPGEEEAAQQDEQPSVLGTAAKGAAAGAALGAVAGVAQHIAGARGGEEHDENDDRTIDEEGDVA